MAFIQYCESCASQLQLQILCWVKVNLAEVCVFKTHNFSEVIDVSVLTIFTKIENSENSLLV